MGVEEYFLHQPDPERPPEFRGWRRSPSRGMVEIAPDDQGGLFSESLNLWLRWEDPLGHVRLLRPYLPDGTPIPTSIEEKHLKEAAEAMAEAEAQRQREAEAELERLRAQLANRQDEGA